jgi:hypothetical protein
MAKMANIIARLSVRYPSVSYMFLLGFLCSPDLHTFGKRQ